MPSRSPSCSPPSPRCSGWTPGTLGLDESIHAYVDLAGTTIFPDVTLRHLLTHTSGIADDAEEEAGESYEALWVDKPTYSVTETVDFLPQFVHKPAVFTPGEGCRYCNVGYVLLGLAVERVTGQRYREVVQRDVFDRAGMATAGYFDMRAAVPGVAEGWEPVREDPDGPVTGWRQNIFSYPPIGSPDGGAHATAAGLTRFVHSLQEGSLLSPGSTAAFLTPQVLHHTVPDSAPGARAAVHHAFGLELELTSTGAVRSWYKGRHQHRGQRDRPALPRAGRDPGRGREQRGRRPGPDHAPRPGGHGHPGAHHPLTPHPAARAPRGARTPRRAHRSSQPHV
ncbi:serine hydrolase domain-containing protein [Cellulomonas hominis]